ncbi:RIO1-domain-containing protein [Basidiobolus meristosporus CBS 931.73]|uniref:non-specific serine/threonine protein kinase n=1 Tax=Basidiobolus meristosporus CBS 931.73 TaxID=1314790 RepID=A0A1Y1YI87_9FUNG|nr:RIO1-domain-containing protein [Basidiobolus meristosporus CBS 931.73]|eukprot:ORX97324.1 RIO1-domain-containing protein [Basidiobolus meristosporus CBS 931.73]
MINVKVEMGSKNHEVVPTSLIAQISRLRAGGIEKILGSLAKRNLVSRVRNVKYDGYRLTYGGYDYLALKTFSKRGTIYSVGNQIGVGKESDIYVVSDEHGNQRVLKLHRLGRISFRTIKSNRDYLRNRKSASWMYMSRLSAMKEYAFMKVLKENGFNVPTPIDQNRHCIVMEYLDAFPLRSVDEVLDPGKLYSDLMNLIVKLARYGLIHGDFNEFNLMIKKNGNPILIDFPQMVLDFPCERRMVVYFDRDVECIRDFFRRRYRYESMLYPKFQLDTNKEFDLDVQVAASGFNKKQFEEYEKIRGEIESQKDDENEDSEDSESDDEDYEESEESEVSEEYEEDSEEESHPESDPESQPHELTKQLEEVKLE